MTMADLGTYQMHQLTDAYAFDVYCHLRVDVLGPRGPIEREVQDAFVSRLGHTASEIEAVPASTHDPLDASKDELVAELRALRRTIARFESELDEREARLRESSAHLDRHGNSPDEENRFLIGWTGGMSELHIGCVICRPAEPR